MEGLDDVKVNLIVDDVPDTAEVDGVDDFVITVLLVAVNILGLTPMTYEDISSSRFNALTMETLPE